MVLVNAAHIPPDSVIGSQPSSKLRRVRRSVSPGPLGAARCEGPRVYVPFREVFRSFKHAADVHKPSVGARDGYPHVIVPLPPFRVVKCPTAVSARCFCLFPPHPLVPVGRFLRGSWLHPPPRSLTANILPTVPVYGHPILRRRQTVVVSSV